MIPLRLLVCAASLCGQASDVSFAETLADEIKKRSLGPSFDTSPVTIKVVDVTYRIPRNYLSSSFPGVTVTFPGFKPLTEETRDCFDRQWQFRNPGICTTFQFMLHGSRGPAPGGRAFTASEKLENIIRNTPGIVRRAGPYGYDIYEIGPEEARIQSYRKIEGDVLFTCFGLEQQNSICRSIFRLGDLNHAHFRFRRHQIEHIPEIEAGIRKLMSTFVVQQ